MKKSIIISVAVLVVSSLALLYYFNNRNSNKTEERNRGLHRREAAGDEADQAAVHREHSQGRQGTTGEHRVSSEKGGAAHGGRTGGRLPAVRRERMAGQRHRHTLCRAEGHDGEGRQEGED